MALLEAIPAAYYLGGALMSLVCAVALVVTEPGRGTGAEAIKKRLEGE